MYVRVRVRAFFKWNILLNTLREDERRRTAASRSVYNLYHDFTNHHYFCLREPLSIQVDYNKRNRT